MLSTAPFGPVRGHDAASLRSLLFAFHWLIAGVSVYYLFLLSNGTVQILAPELLEKALINVLVHLLRGEFTVDRNAIDYVAVTHNGSATHIRRVPSNLAAPGDAIRRHYTVLSMGVPMKVRLALFPFAPFAHPSFEP